LDIDRPETSIIAPFHEEGLTGIPEEPVPAYHYEFPKDYSWYFHSYAPLEGVCRVRVFYHDDGVHCAGMLLDYENGGQRALGQCRLHVARSRTYERPSSIAYSNVLSLIGASPVVGLPTYHQRVRVHFGGLPEDVREDEWWHVAMEGTVDFWFKHDDQVAMSVTGKAEIEQDGWVDGTSTESNDGNAG
jgi:hypothetical protein